MKRKSCKMGLGYSITDPAVDERIKRVAATKSAKQLEREKLEEERDRDIRQLLRAGEADNRPVFTRRTP